MHSPRGADSSMSLDNPIHQTISAALTELARLHSRAMLAARHSRPFNSYERSRERVPQE